MIAFIHAWVERYCDKESLTWHEQILWFMQMGKGSRFFANYTNWVGFARSRHGYSCRDENDDWMQTVFKCIIAEHTEPATLPTSCALTHKLSLMYLAFNRIWKIFLSNYKTNTVEWIPFALPQTHLSPAFGITHDCWVAPKRMEHTPCHLFKRT